MKKLVTKLNKKVQDLSIGTLILIVLGIVVLVILILGFTMGWENLWNKINVFGGGTSSISDVTIACRLALPTSDTYTLCQRTWEIKEGNNPKEPVGCRDPRVLQSLGKATTDNLGCTKSCVPKDAAFCTSITAPTTTTCTGACNTLETPTTTGAKITSCIQSPSARTTCSAKALESECNALVGCVWQ